MTNHNRSPALTTVLQAKKAASYMDAAFFSFTTAQRDKKKIKQTTNNQQLSKKTTISGTFYKKQTLTRISILNQHLPSLIRT